MVLFYASFGLVKLEEVQELLDADAENGGIGRNVIREYTKVIVKLQELFIADFGNDIGEVFILSHGMSPLSILFRYWDLSSHQLT